MTLIQQGTIVRNVYLLLQGAVKLTHAGAFGLPAVISLRLKGSVLGASAATSDSPSLVTVTTLTRSIVSAIPSAMFRQLLLTNHEFSIAVNHLYSHELDDELSYITALQASSAQQRLKNLLGYLVEFAEGDPCRPLQSAPLRHYELAQLIRTTPEHLSRVLRALASEEVIVRHKGWILFKGNPLSGLARLEMPPGRASESKWNGPV